MEARRRREEAEAKYAGGGRAREGQSFDGSERTARLNAGDKIGEESMRKLTGDFAFAAENA